ncbi:E3 ubiquitin-protein ligase DCST1 [Holothuria leucospilota]|uniref:E3 ubiquitin-protein ligase DCST1 n=1 Tax=Holothuria leucospilota TaxID=206669 RepID=A0A9Q1H745_HOLLE|nr:E3 ubiquitin-protein ligase DCST1 [Holothuria leucospilota]
MKAVLIPQTEIPLLRKNMLKEDIKLLAKNVKSEFEKIEQEVEGKARRRGKRSSNPKKIEEDFEKKLDFQCEDMFSVAKAKCRQRLRDVYQRCLDKIPLPGVELVLCLPMKAEFVCEIIGFVTKVCDASDVKTDHLGKEYLKAKEKMGELDEMFRANIKWQEKVKYEVNKRKVWFDVALKLVTSLLSFTFLLVFLRRDISERHVNFIDIPFLNLYP